MSKPFFSLTLLSFLSSFTLQASDWDSDDEKEMRRASRLIPGYSEDIKMLTVILKQKQSLNQELQQLAKVGEDAKENNKKKISDIGLKSLELYVKNRKLEEEIYLQTGSIPQTLSPEEEDFCEMMMGRFREALLEKILKTQEGNSKLKNHKS